MTDVLKICRPTNFKPPWFFFVRIAIFVHQLLHSPDGSVFRRLRLLLLLQILLLLLLKAVLADLLLILLFLLLLQHQLLLIQHRFPLPFVSPPLPPGQEILDSCAE